MAAWTRACSRSSAARSPSRRTRLSCTWASAPRLSARAEASWSRAPTSWFSTAAIWSRSRRIRSAASCSRSSRSASWTAWSSRLVAQPAHAVGDLAVLVRDAVEELGALEQVAEAVGGEDHGERVGRVGLVDLHEPGGQDPARRDELAAQPLEPVARRLQPVAHGEQLRLLLVEAVLHADEAALGGADLALDRVDARVEALDGRAEHALLRLVLLDLRRASPRCGTTRGPRGREAATRGRPGWPAIWEAGRSSSSRLERRRVPPVSMRYAGEFSAREGATVARRLVATSRFPALARARSSAPLIFCAWPRRKQFSPATQGFRPAYC